MNHIISKCEREQEFLRIKKNKSCVFNPMGVCGFHGVLLFMAIESMLCTGSAVGSAVLLAGCIQLGRAGRHVRIS